MQDTYDPFSYLLNEIRAYDAGLREDWEPYQRDHYLEVLLIEEAQEIAWGRRHITVLHGPIVDDVEAELLDELFAMWEEIAEVVDWARIGGVPDDHMTITVAGPRSEEALALAADTALKVRARHWTIVETAIPGSARSTPSP